MAASQSDTLREQIAYYRARADEYDEWFLRTGRYDHGDEENSRWHAEAAQVADTLERFLVERPIGAALEFAAGTGLWTQRLAPHCAHLTALDAAPETLAINRARQGASAARVEFEVADLFAWRPQRRYDLVFFSFWLSHVPPERFDAFWTLVRDCLAPDGRVFLIDSLYALNSSARDHQRAGTDATQMTRRLNDGREYHIYKVFYTPQRLSERLAALGWQAGLTATPTYFLFGQATASGASGATAPR
jgi:demethylmenaquinone methyltransferase/2-methoxy-6-polyprenyl-1,4-benzoquinol methylase